METGVCGKDLGELERLLGLFEAGKLSGALTVARLLLVSRDVASIERWLIERVTSDSGVRTGLVRTVHLELLRLIDQHRHGCQCVAMLRGQAVEVGPGRTLGTVRPPPTREAAAPGRGALAEAAIGELIERFDGWGVLGERRTLGLGCGAGQMQAKLSPRVAFATGVDTSPELIARARWCFARLRNVRYEVSAGHDLSAFDDASFQLVYVVNPVPSLVGSSDARVTDTFAEVARVLTPSGDFVIVEPARRSSGGDAAGGAIERQLRSLGFGLVASGGQPFRCLDGVSYHMRRC